LALFQGGEQWIFKKSETRGHWMLQRHLQSHGYSFSINQSKIVNHIKSDWTRGDYSKWRAAETCSPWQASVEIKYEINFALNAQ